MKKNIFEGAKFGDKFKTNTNLPALYIRKEGNEHILVVKPGPIIFCGDDGISSPFRRTDYIALSIVSRYQEPIDENKLNKLAEENNTYAYYGYCETKDVDKLHQVFNEGFIACYRKIMEE